MALFKTSTRYTVEPQHFVLINVYFNLFDSSIAIPLAGTTTSLL